MRPQYAFPPAFNLSPIILDGFLPAWADRKEISEAGNLAGFSIKKVLDKGRLIYYVKYHSRRFIFDSVPLRLFKDSDKGKPQAIGGHKATGHIQNLDEVGF